MVNLRELNLNSDIKNRLLFFSSLLLQSHEQPQFFHPPKVYVYENLIKVKWLDHFGGKLNQMPEEFDKDKLVIKHDQNFEKAYLGFFTLNILEKKLKWEGDPAAFSIPDQ